MKFLFFTFSELKFEVDCLLFHKDMDLNIGNECVRISSFLKNSVIAGFGPHGIMTLTQKDTGTILVTNTGIDILSSLNVKSLVGQMIVSALSNHFSTVGDFTKSFIILLASAVSQTCNLEWKDKHMILKILPRVKIILEEKVFPIIQNNNTVTTRTCLNESNKLNVIHFMEKLILSTLHGRIPRTGQQYIIKAILNLILYNEEVSKLKDSVQYVYRHINHVIIQSAGHHISATRFLPGIILDQNFTPFYPLIGQEIKFVILDNLLDSKSASEGLIQLNSEEVIDKMLTMKDYISKIFVSKLVKHKVNLVLSTSHVDEGILDDCKQLNIVVLSYVSEDELLRLRCHSDIQVICSLHQMLHLSDTAEKYFGIAKCISKVIVNGRSKVLLENIQGGSGLKNYINGCQLLVCASSLYLCSQITNSIKSTFIVLMAWFDNLPCIHDRDELCDTTHQKNAHKHGALISGGGLFEITLCKEIQKMFHIYSNEEQFVFEIVTKSLQNIPLALSRNRYQANGKLIGPNCKTFRSSQLPTGNHGSVCSNITCESLYGKYSLVLNVLDLLNQILKLGHIVCVSNLPEKYQEDSGEDTEDSCC